MIDTDLDICSFQSISWGDRQGNLWQANVSLWLREGESQFCNLKYADSVSDREREKCSKFFDRWQKIYWDISLLWPHSYQGCKKTCFLTQLQVHTVWNATSAAFTLILLRYWEAQDLQIVMVPIVQLLLKSCLWAKKGIHLAYEDKKLLLVQLKSQQSNHRIVFHLDLTVKEKKNKKWNEYYYTSSLNNTVKIGIHVHTHTSWFLPLFNHIMLLPLSLRLMVLAGERRGWGLLEQIVVWIPSLQRIWCCFSPTIWSLRVIFICLLTHFCTFPLH